MFKNYLKTGLRNLLKHRADSAINLIGLCLAFTSALLLFLSVYYEFSFDNFHERGGRIYMPYSEFYAQGKLVKGTTVPIPYAPTLKASFPEIERIARTQNRQCEIEANGKKLSYDVLFTDPDFLEMFSFPLVAGSKSHALDSKTGIVLRESVAAALFGRADPMGKTVRVQIDNQGTSEDAWQNFMVTGVTAEVPDNSSLRYDMIVRFENEPRYAENSDNWNNWMHVCHLQLRPGASPAQFTAKSKPFVERYFSQDVEQLKKAGVKAFEDGSYMRLGLLPVADYHTDPDIDVGPSVKRSYLYLLLTVGLLIVTIACINFINLSIGRSFTRTREVGLRKTLGAMPWQLAIQFWIEVVLICLVAFVISGVSTYLLLPYFKQLFALSLEPSLLFTPPILLTAFGIFLLVTLVAGGYPVWLIARLQVADVLRGRSAVAQPPRIRNTLIVAQFSIATVLLICTVVAWQQIDYLRSRPLGFNRHQVVSVPVGGASPARMVALLRQQLSGQPGILSTSGIYSNLGKGRDGGESVSKWGFTYKDKQVQTHWVGVSYDFAKTLDLQLIAGRDFSDQIPSDSSCVLINETMAALLGEKDPIGALLPVDSAHPKRVIGVVKDFNFQSLHQKVAPLTLVLDRNFPSSYLLVKVAPTNLPASMDRIRGAYQKAMPEAEFRGSFLDENIERQYQHEERMGTMFISGAVTAILLSCMGLLAVVILVLAQRTREIGIRKVLGASVAGLVGFIFKDFLRLVLIALVIASPVAWYLSTRWLEDFSYRISIHWWVFALAGVGTVCIAFLTILARTLRAALANPVKSLRSE